MKTKSQISVDFIIVVALMLIIFLAIFRISVSRTGELYGSQQFLNAKTIADTTAFHINSVFLAGHGTVKSLYLPEGLSDGTPYTLTIYPAARIVEIRWGDRNYASPIVTSKVRGALNLPYGSIDIKNDMDEVIAE